MGVETGSGLLLRSRVGFDGVNGGGGWFGM